MERVARPLRIMGARISTDDGRPPVRVQGGQRLKGIDYSLEVASAQVKSAILLAGLYAEGRTRLTEPAVTRDHSERMLRVPHRRADGGRQRFPAGRSPSPGLPHRGAG